MKNLNEEDLQFLKELAHKRKEYTMFFDEWGEELYNTYYELDKENLENFKGYIKDNFNLDEDELEALQNLEDNAGLEEFIYLYDIDINSRTFTREYFISYSSGPFLTKEAAKQHLKDNYYHYSKNARTYGLVGWRNPEFERLMEIVEKFDEGELIC